MIAMVVLLHSSFIFIPWYGMCHEFVGNQSFRYPRVCFRPNETIARVGRYSGPSLSGGAVLRPNGIWCLTRSTNGHITPLSELRAGETPDHVCSDLPTLGSFTAKFTARIWNSRWWNRKTKKWHEKKSLHKFRYFCGLQTNTRKIFLSQAQK